MESIMGAAIFIEVAFLSFLLALWAAWLGLNGLFRLLPVTSRNTSPIRFVANNGEENESRHAA